MKATPRAVVDAIHASRYMLDLEADWDDEGAAPTEFAAWCDAVSLLRGTAVAFADELPVPDISPCNDGSVDLFWKTPAFMLLINAKPNRGGFDYYGESKRCAVKGVIGCDVGSAAMILRQLVPASS